MPVVLAANLPAWWKSLDKRIKDRGSLRLKKVRADIEVIAKDDFNFAKTIIEDIRTNVEKREDKPKVVEKPEVEWEEDDY